MQGRGKQQRRIAPRRRSFTTAGHAGGLNGLHSKQMPTGFMLETSLSRTRANEILTPYVPRLVVNWLRETPDALHQQVDGTMVFVDISGFTALSERLARRGKIGAELMRDTLNGVFV